MEEANTPPRSPLPSSHPCWWIGGGFAIYGPQGSLSGLPWTNVTEMLDTRASIRHCAFLHDQFWWPGMATQMQKAISNCEECIQHEGTCAKAPMWPIIVTASLRATTHWLYQHWDNNGIESPKHGLHFGLCDHLMKHVMAYMTPNQTARTVAKCLWQG